MSVHISKAPWLLLDMNIIGKCFLLRGGGSLWLWAGTWPNLWA
jgi:hypothetical protein